MRTIITQSCKQCGKSFLFEKHGRQRQYCSQQCAWISEGKAKQHRVMKVCEYCGKNYEKYYCLRDSTHYCSRICQNRAQAKSGEQHYMWKGGKGKAFCIQCGKEIIAKRIDVERKRTKFCSIRCKGDWQAIHKIGENSNNWHGGLSFEEYPPGWATTIRKQIRERDHNKCMICGKTTEENGRALDVHHIDYDKKNIDPMNLISLCRWCHLATNNNRPYWQARLSSVRIAL